MREVTQRLIHDFHIYQKGYEFMGSIVTPKSRLSFHHYLISKRECKRLHIPNDGYNYDNGVILVQNVAHDELHQVEKYDYDRFLAITSELHDERIKRRIDIENLKYIRDILISFEKEYPSVIKEEFIKQRIKLP